MKDYRDCPYWKENRCSGFNCCLEEDCKHSGKYQPWLKSSVIYPGLAYQALRITIELCPGYSWDKIVNTAWHKYQQICHGVDREDNFYTWADQQRRERGCKQLR